MPRVRNKKIIEYSAPSLLIGGIFLTVLAINGLWPFGRDTIDYYDMAQQAVPFYYHNHDELHGLKSFVFDWYINLGRVIPGLSEPSLFDVLLFFVPRSAILQIMSIFMLIKIMAAAFTMHLFVIYVNKDLPYVFRVMLSAGYGLCGFVLANYTIPQWIDMAVLVPLILMFSQISLKEGRTAGLAVSVFLIMLEDYYFSIQALTLIFLTGGAFVLLRLYSDRRSGNDNELYVRRFAAGIFAGLGFSAFSWVSDIAFNLTSARFENNTKDAGILGAYLEILSNTEPGYLSRWFSLMCLAFPMALAVTGIVRHLAKKETVPVLYWLLCIFMVTAQLIFESIHLILHFGSYVNYPVRNGFMIYCIIAGIAAYAYKDVPAAAPSEAGNYMVRIVSGMVLLVLVVVIARRIYVKSTTISDHTVLLASMMFMAVCAGIHIILIVAKGSRYRAFSLCVWLLELLLFGMIMIGKPRYSTEYGSDPEQEGEYIRITQQLVDAFGDDLAVGADAATSRIKNPDTSLNANYGMIMQRETLCGWTSFATPEQIKGATSLGYSNQYTRILDSGGNIFSDTLLHITDVISHVPPDGELYEKISQAYVETDHITGKKETYGLYRNRFVMPFAIPVKDPSALGQEFDDTPDLINSYSKAFGAGPVASVINVVPETSSKNGHEMSVYHIRTEGRKTLYFTGDCVDTDHYNTSIVVNGEILPIPSIKENDNKLFPAHFNNNTVELGSFENEEVEVVIDKNVSDPEKRYDHYLYEIDRDALADLCADVFIDEEVVQGSRSIDIEIKGETPDLSGILVPISYDRGWTAEVDGKETIIQDVNGLFMFIPLKDGHQIRMSYFPPLMKTGAAVTVISLVIFILMIVSDRRKKPVVNAADKLLAIAYAAAYIIAFFLIYVLPMVYAVKNRL